MSKIDEPKIAIKREQSSLLELSSVSDLSNAMELAPIAEARMIFEAEASKSEVEHLLKERGC